MDPQSAVDGNDLTALISGCGAQLAHSGYLVCRQVESQPTREAFLVFHTPPQLNCQEEFCTYIKVFLPDGRPTLEKAIPKGESSIQVYWNELTDQETFSLSDRGFYGVSVTTYYLGPEGKRLKTFSSGLIFMHVTRKQYTSLFENEFDENFVWIWKTQYYQTLKVTTGYRAYVSPKTEPPLNSQTGFFAP